MIETGPPFEIGGFVLAGGQSSRMGSDKALLSLGGRPMVAWAVERLRSVCKQVWVLGREPALASFAPLIVDLHPGCGPVGGMEAALAHTPFEWNLFLAVDLPFLPAEVMADSVRDWLETAQKRGAVFLFRAAGRPQPGFSMLHRRLLPHLSRAIADGERKLMRVFQEAGREVALANDQPPDSGLWCEESNGTREGDGAADMLPSSSVLAEHWFTNVNTPEDLRNAQLAWEAMQQKALPV